jgi:signal transduction histidine kinase/HAMP domain-containing protein
LIIVGQTVSAIEQHISLEGLPLSLGPENRITEYQQNPPESPNLLVFRRDLQTDRGTFDFVAVLANDYQNLSLVRRLRRVDEESGLRDQGPATPYFAYTLDVYDESGKPLYNQAAPTRLGEMELERIRRAPYFWQVDGHNTIFYFKDRSYIYKITHKATPLRMILVRFLALFLVMSLIMRSALLLMLPGRGWHARWRRSFALKLSGFMFLCSVLPTSMLGYLLINSIQRNQTREEESLARSKILAARDLFQAPSEQSFRGDDTAQIPDGRDLQNFARLVGEDLSLYVSGSMIETNQPELFRTGLLNRRLSHQLAEELLLGKQTHVLDREMLAGGSTLMVAYTVVPLDHERDAILSMTMIPFNQRQKFRWWEQLEFSVTVLFGLLFIMALLTRFFARGFLQPVAAITRGAARMAKGVDNRPIQIQRQDELERMVLAFNTMQSRVRESRSRLKQQLYVLDETLESMSGGLLGFNIQGEIILENSKVWELLQLAGNAPRDLDSLILARPSLSPLEDLFARDRAGDFGFTLSSDADERELLARLRNVATAGGHELRCILVIEDVTDAVTASRFKAWSEMARRVAHEIKNPLTPIQLEVDHLVRLYQDGHERFGEALTDAAQQVGRQVQDLRRIATEFGDYARPLSLEKRAVALDSLLKDITDPYQKTMPTIQIESDLQEDLTVEVDDRLIKRAIHNLVVNAVQAMEEEGRLGLKLFTEDTHAVIYIEDTGPGIPDEERSRIFEAYFSTKDQGTGLGLVIAKRYINLHDGTLSIDSTYTQGTRLVIRLPLHK